MPVIEKKKVDKLLDDISRAHSKLAVRLAPVPLESDSEGAPSLSGLPSRWKDPSLMAKTYGSAAEIGSAIREIESAIRAIKGCFQ